MTAHTSDTSDNSSYEEYNDIKTYLSWTAPGRPFRKKGRQFFATVVLLAMLVEIILFLFGDYFLMLVVLSLTFLVIALHLRPPKDFHYRISSEGVKVEDHFYIWDELYDFYFKRIDGVDTLILRTQALIPGELKITLGHVHRSHARKVLVQFLPYREFVRQTVVERWGDWLSRNFPLDNA